VHDLTRAIESEASAGIRRLQPLRLLLAGNDRRFIRVMSFLLAQRGYDVAQASPPDTIEAAERHRSDVVLLELGESRVTAWRRVAALQALSTVPSVLVVLDDGDEAWHGVPAILKWAGIDELVEAIEAAALARPTPFADGEAAQL
jgi:CheY-like chemotaxis protein